MSIVYPMDEIVEKADASYRAAIGDAAGVRNAIYAYMDRKRLLEPIRDALERIAESGAVYDGRVHVARRDVFPAFIEWQTEYPRYREKMFWRNVEGSMVALGVEVVWKGETTRKTGIRIAELRKPLRSPLSERRALHVLARDNYTCRYCGRRTDLTVDHIVPVIQGGTNHLDNLQTLCRPCNSRKGGR